MFLFNFFKNRIKVFDLFGQLPVYINRKSCGSVPVTQHNANERCLRGNQAHDANKYVYFTVHGIELQSLRILQLVLMKAQLE